MQRPGYIVISCLTYGAKVKFDRLAKLLTVSVIFDLAFCSLSTAFVIIRICSLFIARQQSLAHRLLWPYATV